MTTGPGSSDPEPTQPYGSAAGSQPPPPTGPPSPHQDQYQPPPPPPPYGAAPTAPYGVAVAGFGGAYGVSPQAPYGVHPPSGIPYSDKQKLTAGLLGIFLGGFGVGRFYIGDTKIGVLQLVVTFFTCGLGSLWGLIDGIMMLASDTSRDVNGYILRP